MSTAEEDLALGPDRSSLREKSFLIRPATTEDVEAVAAIEAMAFSNPWQAQTFRSLIRRSGALITVAEAEWGEILGYSVAWWVQDQAELANLAVRENFRGWGVGSALLDRVLLDLKNLGVDSLFLEVRFSNERAFALYRSRGFSEVAVRQDYYRNPREDARILLKALRENARS
jgi:ribosomal-protein-alanine N-acetyltransferase